MSAQTDRGHVRNWSTTPERSNLLAIRAIAWIATQRAMRHQPMRSFESIV